MAKFLPVMKDWNEMDPIYAVLHQGKIIPCAPLSDPAEIPQNPSYLTVHRAEDLHPDNIQEFEQILLEVTNLREEYLAGFNFMSSFVLFPVPFDTAKELLGDVISRKFTWELQALEAQSDRKEWKLLTGSTMKEFVNDHQWLLDKIGNRVLENMILQGLFRND